MANDWNVMAAMMQGGMYGPNPYSQFPGRIPMAGYTGWPTDAMGNPIAKPPGMTLNSVPASAAASSANASASGGYGTNQWAAMTPQARIAATNAANPDPTNAAFANAWMNTSGAQPSNPFLGGGGGQAQAAATAPAANPSGLTSDQYLSLLANPGKVTTPGAQIQASPSPSVLQSFLASRQGGTGAGNYTNQPFFDTLNRLGGR